LQRARSAGQSLLAESGFLPDVFTFFVKGKKGRAGKRGILHGPKEEIFFK
jgi:hypothetical protein